jgi:RNA polymerase sigma-70 factor (ECF subfamily)
MPHGRPLRSTERDERLLIEAAQRDPDQFGELYELHFERLYAYIVRRVRDRSEAQDLTSEVFHQALTNLANYEWRGIPFAAWLFRMAANAIADRGKRLAKEQGAPSRELADGTDLEEIEHRAEVFRFVRDLPPDQRRVLEMRFVDEKSIREIAVELDRSEGAVKQLQFRGIEGLRARIGDQNG